VNEMILELYKWATILISVRGIIVEMYEEGSTDMNSPLGRIRHNFQPRTEVSS
jgi:hypothetical protein